MKRNLTMTKVLIAIIGLTLTSCSSWRYNNPRVSVDKEKVMYAEPINDAPKEISAVPSEEAIDDRKSELKETGTVKKVIHTPAKIKLVNKVNKKLPVVVKPQLEKSKPPFEVLANHFKKLKENINKTKHVEKAEASGWVRIMIILFVVGFILILVGIFLSVFIYGGFWWLFYGFGALLILAGIIVLILGLLGLI